MADLCSLHSGLEERIKAERDRDDIRFQMIEESIRVARGELERRLESMNELREQLNSQAKTFETKAESRLIHDAFEDRISKLERTTWARQGEYRWSNHIVTVIIGAIVIFVVRWLVK